MRIFCLPHSDPKCFIVSFSACALYKLIMSVHLPACEPGDYFLVQSNLTIMISVYMTPRLSGSVARINHIIILLSITTLIYNSTNVSPGHKVRLYIQRSLNLSQSL